MKFKSPIYLENKMMTAKFPYQGLGDTPIRDKFYKLINNTEVKYDLKRFYIPRKVDQINTKVLLNEIIKRIKKKFLK